MNYLRFKLKKRIRLKDFDYTGLFSYFITLCAEDRQKVFVNPALIEEYANLLRVLSEGYHFAVHAFCFMPDHLHLLIEGTEETSDMKRFISMFKQKTGFHYKRKFGKRLWQINYYEYVLREEEDIKGIARYIFENPVRAGLADNLSQYPFSGSFVFDFKEFS